VAGPRVRARGVFAPAVLERLVAEHRAGRADHGHRLWLLINLEIWLRTAIDGEDRATVLQPAARRPRAA